MVLAIFADKPTKFVGVRLEGKFAGWLKFVAESLFDVSHECGQTHAINRVLAVNQQTGIEAKFGELTLRRAFLRFARLPLSL